MARRLPPEMNAKAVQPAYEKWQAVAIGMSRDEVVAILGDPIKDDCHRPTRPTSITDTSRFLLARTQGRTLS